MPREVLVYPPKRGSKSVDIRIEEYELPPLGPKEVRIQTEFSAPKHGTEKAVTAGGAVHGAGATKRWDPKRRIFIPLREDELKKRADAKPRNMGNISVGEIVEKAADVTEFDVGDRVFGYMPIRQVQQVEVSKLRPLGTLDPKDAVCADPAHVAFVAVRDGNVRIHDRVAVFGLGAIGLLTVQIAKAAGAERIFAIDPIAKRREIALADGADVALDPTACDVGLEIKDATNKEGVDVALETSGSSAALHESIRCVMQCGIVVHIAFNQQTAAQLMLGAEWHHNRPTLIGSQAVWQNPDRSYPLWTEERARLAAIELLRRGVISGKEIVDPVVAFDDVVETLKMIYDRPQETVKIGVQF